MTSVTKIRACLSVCGQAPLWFRYGIPAAILENMDNSKAGLWT